MEALLWPIRAHRRRIRHVGGVDGAPVCQVPLQLLLPAPKKRQGCCSSSVLSMHVEGAAMVDLTASSGQVSRLGILQLWTTEGARDGGGWSSSRTMRCSSGGPQRRPAEDLRRSRSAQGWRRSGGRAQQRPWFIEDLQQRRRSRADWPGWVGGGAAPPPPSRFPLLDLACRISFASNGTSSPSLAVQAAVELNLFMSLSASPWCKKRVKVVNNHNRKDKACLTFTRACCFQMNRMMHHLAM
jgi:hypothetical protein